MNNILKLVTIAFYKQSFLMKIAQNRLPTFSDNQNKSIVNLVCISTHKWGVYAPVPVEVSQVHGTHVMTGWLLM